LNGRPRCRIEAIANNAVCTITFYLSIALCIPLDLSPLFFCGMLLTERSGTHYAMNVTTIFTEAAMHDKLKETADKLQIEILKEAEEIYTALR